MSDIRRSLIAFSLGTLASLITIAYVGQSWKTKGKRRKDVPIENIMIGVPLFYGFTNLIAVEFVERQKITGWKINVTIGLFGAAMGLLFSLFGRNNLGLPEKIFGLSEKDSYKVHIYAPILYFAIFSIVVATLDRATVLNGKQR